MINKIALILTIIGGINWGLIGIFQIDAVAWAFRRLGKHLQPHHLYPRRPRRDLVHFAPLPPRNARRGSDGGPKKAAGFTAAFLFSPPPAVKNRRARPENLPAGVPEG